MDKEYPINLGYTLFFTIFVSGTNDLIDNEKEWKSKRKQTPIW